MKIQKALAICVLSLSIVAISFSNALATTIFMDNFEGGLFKWTGKYGEAHHGVVRRDPLAPCNRVLTFTARSAAGEVFTRQQFNLVSFQEYLISFDYLGLARPGSIPGDLGGYAGISEGLPGRHLWYYGTSARSGASAVLVDDGQWHSYDYYFTAPVIFTEGEWGVGNNIRLMFEDFIESGGVPRDVYFDNISLSVVPEPASVLLLASGLIGLFSFRKKKKLLIP